MAINDEVTVSSKWGSYIELQEVIIIIMKLELELQGFFPWTTDMDANPESDQLYATPPYVVTSFHFFVSVDDSSSSYRIV